MVSETSHEGKCGEGKSAERVSSSGSCCVNPGPEGPHTPENSQPHLASDDVNLLTIVAQVWMTPIARRVARTAEAMRISTVNHRRQRQRNYATCSSSYRSCTMMLARKETNTDGTCVHTLVSASIGQPHQPEPASQPASQLAMPPPSHAAT
jgi:hypothetical protein